MYDKYSEYLLSRIQEYRENFKNGEMDELVFNSIVDELVKALAQYSTIQNGMYLQSCG